MQVKLACAGSDCQNTSHSCLLVGVVMRIAESASQYLAGGAYSNGLEVLFELDQSDRHYCSRSDVLADMCAGKDVIHVGCVDHDVSSIVKKQKRKKWLHGVLCASARRCYGVDIEEEGIRYLSEELGYEDVAALDILTQPHETLDGNRWDFLLVPEVLEHVNDPFGFLCGLHRRFSGNVGKLVVTVPNAFARENFRHAGKGVEIINSDHRFWFTPYTLGKLAVLAGFGIDGITLCRHGKVKRRSFIKNRYFSRHPLLRSDIVMTLSFQAVA